MKILCYESGGTKLVAALADEQGRLLERRIRYREKNQDARTTIAQLLALGKELVAGKRIGAVGFGFGGTVRRADGQPLECYHERGWQSVDLTHTLADAFQVPVFIENDCNLAAVAESQAFGSEFLGTLLYITIGTGIGGGLIRRGELLQLSDVGEAEIGHVVVDPEGPPCPCGNRGCLETLCSGPGLTYLSRRLLGRDVTAPDLMIGFKRGEKDATRVVSQAASYLGIAVAAAVTLLAPKVIVFGGGVMKDNRKFLKLIEARAFPMFFPPFRTQGIDFRLSRLEEDVVCQGAALYCVQQLRQLELDFDI